MLGLEVPPAVEAERVVAAVLADLRSGDHRGVVVDSPPGAGKSTLVVRAAVELAAAGEPLMIVAQTNEQVDDLIDRLAAKAPELRIGRLSAADYRPSRAGPGARHGPGRGQGRRTWATRPSPSVRRPSGPRSPRGGGRGRSSTRRTRCARTRCCGSAGRFERALFVGDPGQLDPFSTVETRAGRA